jgi:hypothetical protein
MQTIRPASFHNYTHMSGHHCTVIFTERVSTLRN